ncbi:hypothetical protein L484_012966 [Morus notabilis]|uniref:Uncharacterized protein n=1 Tax=Morus notabilis TaxID=981085 RepID=W9SQL7_9ROSA|nr:hypothetical protein L484_012966 [Morus notabilis]
MDLKDLMALIVEKKRKASLSRERVAPYLVAIEGSGTEAAESSDSETKKKKKNNNNNTRGAGMRAESRREETRA